MPALRTCRSSRATQQVDFVLQALGEPLPVLSVIPPGVYEKIV